MKKINQAQWDSEFFKKKIYSVLIDSHQEVDTLHGIINLLINYNADGAYFILNEPSLEWQNVLTNEGMVLYDEKVVFSKKLQNSKIFSLLLKHRIIEIEDNLNAKMTQQLKELCFSAGQYSRFKSDPVLADRFEDLYLEWLNNSLKGDIADKVFVAIDNLNNAIGFITCKKTALNGNIGLIAVDEAHRGMGVGKDLIFKVEQYYIENNINYSYVATQKQNKIACSFYLKYGYNILTTQPVFHFWF